MVLSKLHITCVLCLLATGIFLFGFSNQDNPLIGKWECNTQETMESMDTSQMSDMERQMYIKYLESIELKVTKEMMTITNFQNKDTSKYELLDVSDEEVVVLFTEDEEKDSFDLLGEDKVSWTLDLRQGEVRCILERQQ